MKCNKCGFKIDNESNFCQNCGSSISDQTISMESIDLQEDFAYLEIIRGPNQGTRIALKQNTTTLGREGNSDIMLDDITVSRHHAKIELNDNKYSIIDEDSLNGVLVNNELIKESILTTGDRIQIGKFTIIFVDKK